MSSRRTSWAKVSAVAVVVVSVAGSALTGVSGGDSNSLARANDANASDPAVIAETIADSLEGALASSRLVKLSVDALDAQDNALEGDKRLQALRWKATASTGDGGEIQVLALPSDDQLGGTAEEDCSIRLKFGHAVTCTVNRADGTTFQHIQRGAMEIADLKSWPLVKEADFKSQGDHLWLMQQTIARGDDGTGVYVQEVARTQDWESAQKVWRLDSSQMESIGQSVSEVLSSERRSLA